ncbi:hypothetical protein BpHYR1_019434 [Brachionus plicatilis]|uniref:Uncharacterized protein n=1 Tax=Brachionus plicatilis TaxID=10195 RepID=A0A3M7PE03_BRAPC|nr:hypothetical protein BpHYR1_019434 [Brachionus plicatilis]
MFVLPIFFEIEDNFHSKEGGINLSIFYYFFNYITVIPCLGTRALIPKVICVVHAQTLTPSMFDALHVQLWFKFRGNAIKSRVKAKDFTLFKELDSYQEALVVVQDRENKLEETNWSKKNYKKGKETFTVNLCPAY